MAEVRWSVSTWRQPLPPEPTRARRAVLATVVDRIQALGARRIRVAVDGRTAAGKTTFGHELALRLAASGRDVLRASLDDFKRPWSESHRYDRVSGDGYYRNAFDLPAISRLLLDPAAPDGSGLVALCSIDPLTQIDHSSTIVEMARDAVLVVDGVFALRPELDPAWDVRVWLEIDAELALQRGVTRDAAMEGDTEQAEALHRERYGGAEAVYLEEVDPRSLADVVIDNSDFEAPMIVSRPARRGRSAP